MPLTEHNGKNEFMRSTPIDRDSRLCLVRFCIVAYQNCHVVINGMAPNKLELHEKSSRKLLSALLQKKEEDGNEKSVNGQLYKMISFLTSKIFDKSQCSEKQSPCNLVFLCQCCM